MAKVKIGRPINGISLNGLEYVLDDSGKNEKVFPSKEVAKQFLLSTDFEGLTDEELEDSFVFKEVN